MSGDRFPGDRGGRVVTAEAAVAVPDDVRQEVRDVVRAWLDNTDAGRFTNEVTVAVLSVPSVAEVIARDAKVRAEVDETRARCEREQLGHDGTMWEAADLGVAIAALYPEAGKPDDSDIMPGSEFDGPVVL